VLGTELFLLAEGLLEANDGGEDFADFCAPGVPNHSIPQQPQNNSLSSHPTRINPELRPRHQSLAHLLFVAEFGRFTTVNARQGLFNPTLKPN